MGNCTSDKGDEDSEKGDGAEFHPNNGAMLRGPAIGNGEVPPNELEFGGDMLTYPPTHVPVTPGGGEKPVASNRRKRSTASSSVEAFPMSSAVNTPSTVIKVFGSNESGQLGLDNVDEVPIPYDLKDLAGVPVSNIICGSWHTVVLDHQNCLYAFGEGRRGQLGFGMRKSIKVPAVVPFFKSKRPRHVSCGEEYTIVACDDGVYSFGIGEDGQLGLGDTEDRTLPTRISFIEDPKQVDFIVSGTHHNLLFYKGKLFCFGWNRCGQLMTGDTRNRLSLTEVKFFSDLNVKAAACGVQHTVVLCLNSVYVAGGNQYGQLGTGNTSHSCVPIKLPIFDGVCVKGVSCWYHTVIWCDTGSCYSFGEGAHYKLGNNSTKNILTPTAISAFEDRCILRVICGSEHTLVFCIDGMYIWGNPSPKLGHGSIDTVFRPERSKLTALHGKRIIDFDLGIDHTAVVVEEMRP
eukprot:TRINITY_DN6987_c0_g1_i1.p1 TRINITY_DN6987_c0_g1~~TRINITY_DN6987_c0_g1_i1.p1  ORF type:complete len:461 (+),score=46.02 TRINITY_DN6987_c0_g1_i1:48-1430(+)